MYLCFMKAKYNSIKSSWKREKSILRGKLVTQLHMIPRRFIRQLLMILLRTTCNSFYPLFLEEWVLNTLFFYFSSKLLCCLQICETGISKEEAEREATPASGSV